MGNPTLPKSVAVRSELTLITVLSIQSTRCAENRARWDSLCDTKSAQVTYLNEALVAALGNKFEALPAASNSDDSVDIPSNRSVIFLISLQILVKYRLWYRPVQILVTRWRRRTTWS